MCSYKILLLSLSQNRNKQDIAESSACLTILAILKSVMWFRVTYADESVLVLSRVFNHSCLIFSLLSPPYRVVFKRDKNFSAICGSASNDFKDISYIHKFCYDFSWGYKNRHLVKEDIFLWTEIISLLQTAGIVNKVTHFTNVKRKI